MAEQQLECRILTYIQRRQLIVATIQRRQRRIPAHIQRRQQIVVAVQIRQRRIPAHIQRRQLIVEAEQLLQRFEILNPSQRGKRTGIVIAPRNVQRGDCGDLFHILRRDIIRIGDNTLFLQLLCKGLIELGGEIRIAGCRRLGDGQPYALFPAGQIGISRAGRCPEIAGGRQFDGLFAGRAAHGCDGEPVSRGFGIVVHDRKRPVGHGGKRDRCVPLFGGVERIFGLLDGQCGFRCGRGSVGGVVLFAARKGKDGKQGQKVKLFHMALFYVSMHGSYTGAVCRRGRNPAGA